MTTFHYCCYRDTLVIYIWWHDQKCSRCWLFLNVQIPLHHLYHTLFPLFLYLEADFSWCSLLGVWCQAFIGVKGLFPLCLFSKAEEQHVPHEATGDILNDFCHSLHIIHIFTSIIQTQKVEHSTQKVEIFLIGWNFGIIFYVMLHFITKAKEMYSSLR